jgi:hypothetical protein
MLVDHCKTISFLRCVSLLIHMISTSIVALMFGYVSIMNAMCCNALIYFNDSSCINMITLALLRGEQESKFGVFMRVFCTMF